jgi:hypothetical protein
MNRGNLSNYGESSYLIEWMLKHGVTNNKMKDIKFRMWTGSTMLYNVSDVYECLKQQKAFDEGIKLGEQLGVIPYDHVGDGSLFLRYTGFKDNYPRDISNEIYEKDILCFESDAPHPDGGFIAGTWGFHPEHSIEVIWEDGCFKTKRGYAPKQLLHEILRRNVKWKVIGNTLQHPHLIEN